MRKPPRLASLILGLLLVLLAIWRFFACAGSPPRDLEMWLAPPRPSGSASTSPPAGPAHPRAE